MEYPDYDPELPNAPLTDEELQAFDDMLNALPTDAAMNIEVLDGFLTSLLLGPRLVDRLRTGTWLPEVWGGDGEGSAPFASNRQRKRAMVFVLRHLQGIAVQLNRAPQAWEPIFSIGEVDDKELADAEDWCIGFLHGVSLGEEAWQPYFDDPKLSTLLRPVVILGADESALEPEERQRLSDPAWRDELSRRVADAVATLAQDQGRSSP